MTFNFFIKKFSNIKNYDFSNVVARYGATGFFMENRAVSPFYIYEVLTLGQNSEKSLERLFRSYRAGTVRPTTPGISSPKGENSNIKAAIYLERVKILTCSFRRKFRDTWGYPKSIILRITNL